MTVERKPSSALFRFGDGKEVKSTALVKIPIVLAGQPFMLDTEVVKNEIPLLLSRTSMKRANIILDFHTDTIKVGPNEVKLSCTTTDHYCIPLSRANLQTEVNQSSIVLHTTNLKHLNEKEKCVKAMKLHRQFSHASKEKLLKLVTDSADYGDKEFMECIKECRDNCEICRKYKQQPLPPVVGFPLADDFNQVVCMDLKELDHNESWILHLIDTGTRYSAACIVRTKHKVEIIRQIYRIWISYFGSPKKFMSDNGGEFSNDLFREMNEKLNIETATTAGESPFSNGTVERHNKTLMEAMQKTITDVKCEQDIALAWAVSAKNALQNRGGFSPNQLVFGRNVNTPTILTDKLPTLEPTTSSDIIRKNMEALHSARKNFIQSEASEKVRRALRHKVRSYSDEHYVSGDKVYYKRKNYKAWKGPATVLGQDGQIILVRHGGVFYRIHPCQLLKVKKTNLHEIIIIIYIYTG